MHLPGLLTCPCCQRAFPAASPNHVYCSINCSTTMARRRRAARTKKGATGVRVLSPEKEAHLEEIFKALDKVQRPVGPLHSSMIPGISTKEPDSYEELLNRGKEILEKTKKKGEPTP